MYLTEFDGSRQLLKITVAGDITPEGVMASVESVRSLLTHVEPGFRVFANLSGLLSMPTTTAPYIGQIMDSCAEKGVGLVVHLLPPEPSKDIGFAIMSRFHYGPGIPIVTVATMEEAMSLLK